MTCDNCIHGRVCVIKAFPDAFENTQWGKEPCDHFKSKSEWISVEERVPDNYRSVLVACEYTTIGGGARIAIGSYGGGFWSLADADGTHYLTKYMHAVVTHWMELPEAPKKGGEE